MSIHDTYNTKQVKECCVFLSLHKAPREMFQNSNLIIYSSAENILISSSSGLCLPHQPHLLALPLPPPPHSIPSPSLPILQKKPLLPLEQILGFYYAKFPLPRSFTYSQHSNLTHTCPLACDIPHSVKILITPKSGLDASPMSSTGTIIWPHVTLQ